jgi:poly [ADP-ribose] polymerase 2/3/4
MSNIVSKQIFVKTDAKNNNNKFWEVTLYDNDDVHCRWGRVGATGQSKDFPGGGQKKVNTKVKEKTKKGYQLQPGVNVPAGGVTKVVGSQLKTVAKKQIRSGGCKVAGKLIDYLVQVNRHDITTASGGRLTVDVNSGLITTDVGVAVTQDRLDKARDHLVALSNCITNKDLGSNAFVSNLNDYLMCVPQKVPSKRGWEKIFLINQDGIQKQSSLIDSMESTLQAFSNAPIVTDGGKEEQVFNVGLALINDGKKIDRVRKLYQKTKQTRHSCHRLKVKNVYTVHIESMAKSFEKDGSKKSPVWELWHGTRAANVLSILKCGLVVPAANAAHCTGRVFGNGAYFSDQSTKALNYAYGYWGGQQDNNCFMFLTDVGMGKYHTPSGPIRQKPAGFDSVYAVGGKSGVLNNEMIVSRVSQCNLTHLVEFSA